VSLGLYPGATVAQVDAWIDEIAGLGASHVALVASWQQADVTATAIAPGNAAVPDDLVRAAARHAGERGLAVVVFPMLALERVAAGEWRGTLRPRDPAVWWRAYERFILHYAAIAAASGASGLVIGSELGSTEGWRERWNHLAGRVEQVFAGDLIYSANWDHYQEVSFAARIDVLGVSAYFELDGGRPPTVDRLVRAWAPLRRQLASFARARGVRLWLSELGYPSRRGAAARPWDYTGDQPADAEEQRRCFEAARRAWAGAQELEGVLVWNWYPDGPRGYTPRGKPAEKVLRAWFRE